MNLFVNCWYHSSVGKFYFLKFLFYLLVEIFIKILYSNAFFHLCSKIISVFEEIGHLDVTLFQNLDHFRISLS